MAISNGAGGYQVGSGNRGEPTMGVSGTPSTATSTATLTAAQILAGILVANPSTTAATYTLPTAALIDVAIPNAVAGSTVDLRIVNIGTSTGTVTLAMGTGITNGGNAAVVIPITSSTGIRFLKTADAAWTAYRIS